MNSRTRNAIIVLAVAFALFVYLGTVKAHAAGFGSPPPPAGGHPLTLTKLCTGFAMKQEGANYVIRCPDQRAPWMTFTNCKAATVERLGSTITIRCNNGPH